MKNISTTLKKILLLLLAGSMTVFIAACYGPRVGYHLIGKWVVRVKNSSARPIPGLKVALLRNRGGAVVDTADVRTTDDAGMVVFMVDTYKNLGPVSFSAVLHDTGSSTIGRTYRDTVVQQGLADSTVVTLQH
jgi:hypothetical protein